MATRREDEKNERIIRGLLKLPENRKCINCNSLGPQYVCTNFWTFVCTTCSGIHREFTHRVKSISMAKFTSQEVSALQQGGNERAKEIFFKDWDPQRHSVPDSSNVDRLRDFIKHVYVDRRYSGERNYDKSPRVKMGEKEDIYQGGSRSPPYDESYERRFSERSSPGGRSDDKNYRYSYDERSPGYEVEKRSPARPEIINDWRREDRFGNGRRSEDHTYGDRRSPERQNYSDTSSPPIVRPVRDILGENVVPLRISEPPRPPTKSGDTSVPTQRTASSSSLGSTNDKPVEVKWENSKSLIDFDADPGPPAATVPQAPQTTVAQSVVQPAGTSNDNNWASFDVAPEVKVTQAPSNPNPLDSVLSELSVPVSGGPTVASGDSLAMLVSSGSSTVGHVGNTTALPLSASTAAAASMGNLSALISGGASAAVHGSTPVHPAGQWPSVQVQQQQQQSSLYTIASSHPTTQQVAQMADMLANDQGPQASTRPAQEVTSGVGSQPPPVQVNSSSRKELPENLFTATYPSYPAPVPGWQTGPPHGMVFPMQYNTAVPIPTYQQSSRSINPFDFNNEPAPVQAPVFPSMASLHGALPNVPPQSGLLRTSSLGTPSPTFIPQQRPPYASAVPPQLPMFSAAIPSRPYMVQQVSNMPPSSHQGLGSIGSAGTGLNSSNMDQQQNRGFSAAATPYPFPPVGGNPFG